MEPDSHSAALGEPQLQNDAQSRQSLSDQQPSRQSSLQAGSSKYEPHMSDQARLQSQASASLGGDKADQDQKWNDLSGQSNQRFNQAQPIQQLSNLHNTKTNNKIILDTPNPPVRQYNHSAGGMQDESGNKEYNLEQAQLSPHKRGSDLCPVQVQDEQRHKNNNQNNNRVPEQPASPASKGPSLLDLNLDQNEQDSSLQASLRQSRHLGVKVQVEDISSDNEQVKHRTFQSEMISPQNSLMTNFEESKLSGIVAADQLYTQNQAAIENTTNASKFQISLIKTVPGNAIQSADKEEGKEQHDAMVNSTQNEQCDQNNTLNTNNNIVGRTTPFDPQQQQNDNFSSVRESLQYLKPNDHVGQLSVSQLQQTSEQTSKTNESSNTAPGLDGKKPDPPKIDDKDKPEALPLLPKTTFDFKLPPKCPIPGLTFIQLRKKEFLNQPDDEMTEGFDMVGAKSREIAAMQQRKADNYKNLITAESEFNFDDPNVHEIKNIVFARDTSIVDPETFSCDTKEALQHENVLDVKSLLKRREMLVNNDGASSPIAKTMRYRLNQTNTRDAHIYKWKGPEDRTLLFESRFESGNLYLAQKCSDQEYNLLMQNDVNTQGHTQWFYFRVCNTRKGHTVKFNVLNYSKPDSLFNYGMKVSVYSDKKQEQDGTGWHKDGKNISYTSNNLKKEVNYYSGSYYTATWTYTFQHDRDSVYFAYSVPYTFTDLRSDLNTLEQDQEGHGAHMSRKTLCYTLAGEECEILTITARDNKENFAKRPGIVITGRVHPGETVGSWMMRGVLMFLTDPNNEEARMLRNNFVFKIVPMLNPDGVINGNYRCSLAGCDLNRRWKSPSKVLHPVIYAVKKLVKGIKEERGCMLFCDLHGHSRKQNVFMYGCDKKETPAWCRMFPYMLSKVNPYFSFEDSRFGVQKSKEATARIALFQELKTTPCIYTMESSFAGVDKGKDAGKHLTTDMLESLGRDLCRVILIYKNIYVPPELRHLFAQTGKEDPAAVSQGLMKELCANKALIKGGDGDSSEGSESAPSDDNMEAEKLVKNLPEADKTLKKKIKNDREKKAEDEKLSRQPSLKKKPEAVRRVQSPQKKPEAIKREQIVKPEPVKTDPPKKPKPEMKDAITQTDRSDYQLIKAKMMRERALKAQLEETAQQTLGSRRISEKTSSMPASNQNPSSTKGQTGLLFGNQQSEGHSQRTTFNSPAIHSAQQQMGINSSGKSNNIPDYIQKQINGSINQSGGVVGANGHLNQQSTSKQASGSHQQQIGQFNQQQQPNQLMQTPNLTQSSANKQRIIRASASIDYSQNPNARQQQPLHGANAPSAGSTGMQNTQMMNPQSNANGSINQNHHGQNQTGKAQHTRVDPSVKLTQPNLPVNFAVNNSLASQQQSVHQSKGNSQQQHISQHQNSTHNQQMDLKQMSLVQQQQKQQFHQQQINNGNSSVKHSSKPQYAQQQMVVQQPNNIPQQPVAGSNNMPHVNQMQINMNIQLNLLQHDGISTTMMGATANITQPQTATGDQSGFQPSQVQSQVVSKNSTMVRNQQLTSGGDRTVQPQQQLRVGQTQQQPGQIVIQKTGEQFRHSQHNAAAQQQQNQNSIAGSAHQSINVGKNDSQGSVGMGQQQPGTQYMHITNKPQQASNDKSPRKVPNNAKVLFQGFNPNLQQPGAGQPNPTDPQYVVTGSANQSIRNNDVKPHTVSSNKNWGGTDVRQQNNIKMQEGGVSDNHSNFSWQGGGAPGQNPNASNGKTSNQQTPNSRQHHVNSLQPRSQIQLSIQQPNKNWQQHSNHPNNGGPPISGQVANNMMSTGGHQQKLPNELVSSGLSQMQGNMSTTNNSGSGPARRHESGGNQLGSHLIQGTSLKGNQPGIQQQQKPPPDFTSGNQNQSAANKMTRSPPTTKTQAIRRGQSNHADNALLQTQQQMLTSQQQDANNKRLEGGYQQVAGSKPVSGQKAQSERRSHLEQLQLQQQQQQAQMEAENQGTHGATNNLKNGQGKTSTVGQRYSRQETSNKLQS